MRTLLRCFGGAITSTTTTLTSCTPRLITSSHYHPGRHRRAFAFAPQYPRRSFVAASPAMASSSTTTTPVSFSTGVDEIALSKALKPLLVTAHQGGRWALTPTGEGLERSFKFKTFAKTWDFMTAVSLQCKLKNHHPEWSNVFNTTYIRWTTHSPRGLSAKDVELAALCDALARDFGEIVPEEGGGEAGGKGERDSRALRQVADRVVEGAGAECCVPKGGKGR
ncbi:transcriptional coactivator/pterin dehydratase [Camillea tinctor]|nr:transcriptional coactivator/pterin dehydratase [Camillea tinctor]